LTACKRVVSHLLMAVHCQVHGLTTPILIHTDNLTPADKNLDERIYREILHLIQENETRIKV